MDQNKGYLNFILLIFIFLFTQTQEGLAGEPAYSALERAKRAS